MFRAGPAVHVGRRAVHRSAHGHRRSRSRPASGLTARPTAPLAGAGPAVMILAQRVPAFLLFFGEDRTALGVGVGEELVALLVHLAALGAVVVEDGVVRFFLIVAEQIEDRLIAFLIECGPSLKSFADVLPHVAPDGVHLLPLVDGKIQLLVEPPVSLVGRLRGGLQTRRDSPDYHAGAEHQHDHGNEKIFESAEHVESRTVDRTSCEILCRLATSVARR